MSSEEVIKRILKKSGLSHRGLAKALGFPQNAICYYANGKRKPNTLNCYRIIKFAKKHYDMTITLEELLPSE